MLSPTISSRRSEKRLTMLSSCSCTVSLNDYFRHIQQSLSHNFRLEFPRAALILPLAPAVPAQHKRRMQSGVSREFYVPVAIPNHPTAFQINLEVFRSAIDEARFRFAAVAI